MKQMRNFIFLIFFSTTFYAVNSFAQEEEDFTTISPPLTVELNRNEEDETFTPKEKKKKKNVYYGLKTKKGFTTRGRGDREDLILFNYLKEPPQTDKYVRDIYWYDLEKSQIKSRGFNPQKGVLLHGPYSVRRNDIIIEEGIFYIGTKHGRWIRKTAQDILIDKEKYYKGWPKESRVKFYDPSTRTRILEIIPIEYGQKEGNYYYFFKDGSRAVTGEYRYGERVGKWTSYYENRRGRRKREIQYRKDPDNDKFIPYIVKEWNTAGKVVYDRAKDKVRDQ
jgi:antitoxin component YwqK of YwqJK toxin-antitoxin module